MKTFGVVIKEARTSKGWSLKQAADKLGTFKGYICGIENGNLNPPSPKVVLKMAQLYELDFGELLALRAMAKIPKGTNVLALYHLIEGVISERGAGHPTLKRWGVRA